MYQPIRRKKMTKNTNKNEARITLMATLKATRDARKAAKAKLTETIEAAYAEYRKLVAELKAERNTAIDKYLAAKDAAKKPVEKTTKKAAKKTTKKAAKKSAKKAVKKATKKAIEKAAE